MVAICIVCDAVFGYYDVKATIKSSADLLGNLQDK
jgi:hypothetical protein